MLDNVVKISALPDFIERTILAVRDGIASARSSGSVLAEMPDKIDFTVMVVDDWQPEYLEIRTVDSSSGTDRSSTSDTGTSHNNSTRTDGTTTTTRTSGSDVSTRTDGTTTTTTMSGQDTTTRTDGTTTTTTMTGQDTTTRTDNTTRKEKGTTTETLNGTEDDNSSTSTETHEDGYRL
jgi:hypothetical protein